jgi:uncharacterized protein YndB with AHSA1/START domain
MKTPSVTHGSFTIERSYAAPPARVFHAWADPVAKARWFGGPDEWEKSRPEFDFRVGGRERVSGGPKGGQSHDFAATYLDIIPDRRIIYCYEMHLGAARISISLATVEFRPEGSGTCLVVTEQGAFLDGYDDAGGREEGTRWLLGKLETSLG